MDLKTLRVCLAMGGGVSLGSFSGSALTEALKLLIIYGKDKNGNPYKEVVVDGMSGASAGAIALTIMLRCLIDYKSMLFKWKPKLDTETDNNLAIIARENRLETILSQTYFDNDSQMYSTLSKSKIESLKALQLAQNIQEILWVDSVDTIKLYGDKTKSKYSHNLDDSFGLLERKHMEELIEQYLMGGTPDINNLQVLDKRRILFACSLTNILPMPINADQEDLNILKKNVINSTGVFNHSEVRVIDFIFDETICEEKPSDGRWLKFSTKTNSQEPTHFDITKDEAWATISASALACGAFPIAFPPVLLKRYQQEYNLGYAKEKTLNSWMSANIKRRVYKTKEGNVVSEWPGPFLDIQDKIQNIDEVDYNSFFNDKEGSYLNYKSFNFPYVDGGTFNNEPIKEAYRIASFQEYKRTGSKQNERLVLFVDPIVRKEQFPNFKVSSFSPISGAKIVKNNTELTKFISSVGSLVGLLKNQGRIKEGDKIRDTKENLALKEVMFAYLDNNEDIKLTVEICLKAFDKIRTKLNENIISIGTRQPVEYFIEQLRESSNGNWKGETFELLMSKSSEIEDELLQNSENITIEGIHNLFKITNKPISINIFAATVFKVIAEISLDTAGKNPDAINAAILPIDKDNQIIDLPGAEIEAFAGFASKASKQYAFEYGKLATLKALSSKDGFRDKQKGGAYLKNNIDGDLGRIENLFTNKIRETNFFNADNNYSKDLKTGLFTPSIKRIKIILPNFVKKIWNMPLSLGSLLLPIVGVIGLVSGLISNLKGKRLSIQSILKGMTDDMADAVNYTVNEALIVSVIGDKFNKPWYRFFSKKGKIKVTAILKNGSKIKINAVRAKSKSKIRFHLYVIEYSDSPDYRLNNEKMLISGSSDELPRLKLISEYRTPLPNINNANNAALDPNLDEKWGEALHANYPEEIVAIEIEGVKDKIPLDPNYINNSEKTLYHSLKELNIHVSPMLEFDTRKEKGNWYFKENTKSFHDELLDRKRK